MSINLINKALDGDEKSLIEVTDLIHHQKLNQSSIDLIYASSSDRTHQLYLSACIDFFSNPPKIASAQLKLDQVPSTNGYAYHLRLGIKWVELMNWGKNLNNAVKQIEDRIRYMSLFTKEQLVKLLHEVNKFQDDRENWNKQLEGFNSKIKTRLHFNNPFFSTTFRMLSKSNRKD